MIASDGSYDGDFRFFGKIGLSVCALIILIANISQFSDSRKIKKMKIDKVSQLRQRITEEARRFMRSVLWLKVVTLISVGVAIIIVLIDPAFNLVSYIFCAVLAVEVFGLALYHISFQTNVAKRPLPQFNKKGARYDSD